MTKGTTQPASSWGYRPETVGMCLETLLADPASCDASNFRRIVQASSAARFDSVALWSWRAAQIGVDATRQILDAAGVKVRLAEVRTRWAEGPEAAVNGIDEQLDLVGELGAEMVLAISQHTAMDTSLGAAGFAALCERAATRGLRVTLEFIPCRALRDLATAWQVVRESGASNGGLDIDLMHWQNQPGGPDLALLRSIPARHVHYVQLCDAVQPGPANEDYIATALRARPLPGNGIVDIAAVISTLDAMAAEPFFAMEVFNAELTARGPESMAKRLRVAADSLFCRLPLS